MSSMLAKQQLWLILTPSVLYICVCMYIYIYVNVLNKNEVVTRQKKKEACCVICDVLCHVFPLVTL